MAKGKLSVSMDAIEPKINQDKYVRFVNARHPLIEKDKVVKIEALPNKETPKFFEKAKTVLATWEGKSVKKAAKQDVDGVSGATYSSKALIKNVQLGLQYYNEHK